jgi:recombination protein RecA
MGSRGVGSRKKQHLDAAVIAIQRRWGAKALRRGPGATASDVPHIPTGFPALDRALGIGGLPKGRLVELGGPATSGKITLALKLLAQAQAGGGQVAYVDQARSFDPDYAQRCGLDLARLLVGWPLDGGETLAMTEALVSSGGLAALAFDALGLLWHDPDMGRRLASCLKRLVAPLARSGSMLLFLHEPDALDAPTRSALAHHAAVRLQVSRERWLRRQGDIRGYTARVEVLKNRLGPAGRAVPVSIEFDGTSHTDGW